MTMREGGISIIGEMLERCPELMPNAFIFAQPGRLRSESFVLVDRDGLYDPDYIPELAKVRELNYIITTDAYNDVIEKLGLQIDNMSADQKLVSLVFRVENDAFKNW